MVAAKEKFSKHPVNYAMHKARLMKERDAAMTVGDEARWNVTPNQNDDIVKILSVTVKIVHSFIIVCFWISYLNWPIELQMNT